jgi:hypothetical protein
MNIWKRSWTILLFAVAAAASVPAISVIEDVEVVQPFDSEKRLAEWDFEAPVAQSQRQFIDESRIELLTIGRGDPLYAWFGHSGLVVQPPSGDPVMFDYGIFNFEMDHFYRNFVLGRLYYNVMGSNAKWRISVALDEQRDVRLLTLDLPPEAKLATIGFLNDNVQPENSTYLYHHFKDNCATRLRDIIDSATGGSFKAWAKAIPGTGTYRQHMMRHTFSCPIVDWGLNFLQSGQIDRPITLWEEMFLPEVLEQAVREFSWIWPDGTEHSLVLSEQTVNDTAGSGNRPETRKKTPHVVFPSLIVGLTMGGLALALLTWYRKARGNKSRRAARTLLGLYDGLICLAVGILSSVLLFMMTGSSHDVTWYNENIIFANPWLLVMSAQSFAFAFGREKSLRHLRKGFRILSSLGLVLMIFKGVLPWIFFQANLPILAVLLPYYALQGWIRGSEEPAAKIPMKHGRNRKHETSENIDSADFLAPTAPAEPIPSADTDLESMKPASGTGL